MTENQGMLTKSEILIAEEALRIAVELGANQCRVKISKGLMNLYGTLNGEIDKVSHSLDRSMILSLFVDGRYGTFSTNRLENSEIKDFIAKAVASTKMLEEDKYRKLPNPDRTIKDASQNTSLGITDAQSINKLSSEDRVKMALDFSRFSSLDIPEGFTLLSEEAEYSDTIADEYIIDSNGTKGRQTDSSFEHGVEITLADSKGNKYSSNYWQASPSLEGFLKLRPEENSVIAAQKAIKKVGPKQIQGGKYTMMVKTDCAARLFKPILNALGGFAIQQKNSFLIESLNKQIFPDFLNVHDMPKEVGKIGGRLFDSEGVETSNNPIIENGVVKQYFVSTYISEKTGLKPTTDDATRVVFKPVEKEGLPKEYIIVSDFNGGNCNAVTGDFSYGIEGYFVKNGSKSPIKEMVITGNMISLWNNLIKVCDDAMPRANHQIGSLVFKEVEII